MNSGDSPVLTVEEFLAQGRAFDTSTRPEAIWELLCRPVADEPERAADLLEGRRSLRKLFLDALEPLDDDEEHEILGRLFLEARDRYEQIVRGEITGTRARLDGIQELWGDLLWMRGRLEQLGGDPDDDPLSDVMAEIDWCTRAARHLRDAPSSERPDDQTLDALELAAGETAVGALRQRMGMLEEQLGIDGAGAKVKDDFDSVWRGFLVAGELETAVVALDATTAQDLSDEVAWITEHRSHIRDRVESVLGTLNESEARQAFRRLASDLSDRSEELLVAVDEEPPAEGLAHLEESVAEIDWGIALIDRHAPNASRGGLLASLLRRRDAMRQARRTLQSARSRVISEHVEKTVSLRLEERLGRRGTSLLENSVLFLIFGFLVLMWAESHIAPMPGPTLEVEEEAMHQSARQLAQAMGGGIDLGEAEAPLENMSHLTLRGYGELGSMPLDLAPSIGPPLEVVLDEAHREVTAARTAVEARDAEIADRARVAWWEAFFAYADLFICLVFLFEFFLKLALAPRRWNYFRRHFFIDLLPSIPFGYIAWLVTTGMAPSASAARGVRALRLLRVPRVIRYVRLARPLVRIFRLATFALRGMDRLARRYAGLLNRQVVFFEPAQPSTSEGQARENLLELTGRSTRRYRMLLRELPATERAAYLDRRLGDLQHHLPERRRVAALHKGTTAVAARDLPAEKLLRDMATMDATAAEDLLGRDLVMRLDRVFGMLSAPGIRGLPVVREMVKGLDRLGPFELVAQSLRVLGRLGEKLLSRVYAIADLYGIVTPSQLLDRVGGALVKALGRPAKRLVMFGAFFLLVQVCLGFFESDLLQKASGFFGKVMSTAFLVLGSACILPLLFGMWLKRIAGEASDFYERAVEAQFLGLLRGTKETNLREDLTLLHDRVLAPEERLSATGGSPGREARIAELEECFNRCLPHQISSHDPSIESDGAAVAVLAHHWVEEDRVLQLYREFLDGVPLHRSDVKVANLLLGNLDMDNIHRERLQLKRGEMKKLERLDLAREKSLLGPHMWFRFITDGVSQRTAKLMVNYNQHCLPLEDHATAPVEERERFAKWLDERKLERASDLALDDEDVQPAKPQRLGSYVTTVFTALHFVTVDAERDRLVRLAFGPAVADELVRDRTHIFRSVFGSYPLETLSRAQRTINPYRLYMDHVSGGRILLLPFKMLWLLLRGLALVGRAVVKSVADILNPSFATRDPRAYYASFEVAERKIARMRKPIYMAALHARARFDPEYLGLPVPGLPAFSPEATFRTDLDRIGALEEERDRFENLFQERRRRHTAFLRELRERGWGEAQVVERLRELGGDVLASRPVEAMRAMLAAYLIDYRSCASLCEAGRETERTLLAAIHEGGSHAVQHDSPADEEPVSPGILARIGRSVARMQHKRFHRYWQQSPFADRPVEERELAFGAYLEDRDGVRRHVKHILESGGADAAAHKGFSILTDAARRPGAWSEQLVTLRTVQALTILDMDVYRRLVKELGNYEA